MNEQEFKDHLYDVMSLIPEFFQSLSTEDFLVRTDTKVIAVNCSDIFYWGCADAEEVEGPDDLELFRQSMRDIESIEKSKCFTGGPELYCSRKRGMRPQGAYYKYIMSLDSGPEAEEKTKKLRELFNAAGPEREVESGNPYKPGEY